MEEDRVHELVETLSRQIKTLVKFHLTQETPEIDEAVRERLQEQFRFWKG